MQDIVQFTRNVDELGDIMMIELELFQFEQVFDIAEVTGDEIVHPDHMKTFFDKTVAEMGTQESCCTGNEYSLF